jgi:hypothetical protein
MTLAAPLLQERRDLMRKIDLGARGGQGANRENQDSERPHGIGLLIYVNR